MTRMIEPVIVKGRITGDHKVIADVPVDLPAGDAEVVVRPLARRNGANGRAFFNAIKKAAKSVSGGRSREQIDAELAALREE